TFEADVSSEDPAVVARGLALLQEGVDITARLGGRYFGGILYGAMAKYGHPCTPRGRRNAIEAVRRIADFAGERGVTLGLEVVNRYESNLL
ncbi:sugar phosphate isomerase/epimerase, partial [Staphylococcus aureus]|nr:sugar phosphate isomerase/epimerase [Staphylococcus aureus]